jgi:hypothetical protein
MKTIIKVGFLIFTLEVSNYHYSRNTTVWIEAKSKEIYNPYRNEISQDYFGSSYKIIRGDTEERTKKLFDFLIDYFCKGWKLMNPSLEKKIFKIVEEVLEISLNDYVLKQQKKALNQ